MNVNEFLGARADVVPVMETLPLELKETNAGPLLGVIDELRRSMLTELVVVDAVSKVDVQDLQAVQSLRDDLSYYGTRQGLSSTRTHCGNIALMRRLMICRSPLPPPRRPMSREAGFRSSRASWTCCQTWTTRSSTTSVPP